MDMQSTVFASFLLAAAIVCIAPGSDMLYVMSFRVSQGRVGGVAAAVGVAGGMLVHVILISQYPWLMVMFKGVGIC
jgi:threonine/homoserine/homoserine lactone efflux protein